MKKFSFFLSLVLCVIIAGLALVIATDPQEPGEPGASVQSVDEQNERDEAELNLPLVAFIPAGKFTDDERALLWSHVITPHTDYGACMGQQTVSIAIEKLDASKTIADTTYLYGITAMIANPDGSQNAVTESFIHGTTDGVFDYWTPTLILKSCVDTLPNADDVRDQAVESYGG